MSEHKLKEKIREQAVKDDIPGGLLSIAMPRLSECIREFVFTACQQRVPFLFVGFSRTKIHMHMSGNPDLALARLKTIEKMLLSQIAARKKQQEEQAKVSQILIAK